MHESATILDLMRRVEEEAGPGRRVTSLRIRVGVLSGITSEGVAMAAQHYAEEVWGYLPEVVVDTFDQAHPDALGVRLLSVGVEA